MKQHLGAPGTTSLDTGDTSSRSYLNPGVPGEKRREQPLTVVTAMATLVQTVDTTARAQSSLETMLASSAQSPRR